MADFRTKVITLAGVATMFAGMAYGQACVPTALAACVNSNGLGASAIFIRAEGTTEYLAPSTVTVNQAANAAAVSLNLTVYLSPSVAITSQSKNGTSETSATGGAAAQFGTVSGSSVAFTGITIPASGGAPVSTVITVGFIRVNASTIATSTGVPTGVTETVFVGGTGVTPIVPTPVTVAYALNGLGAATSTTSGAIANSVNTICGGAAVTTTNYIVSVADGFAGSFKTKNDESTDGSAGVSTITATSGTRLTLTFANVPTNVLVYVPLTVQSGALTNVPGPGYVGAGPAILTNTTSPTGAFSATADAKAKGEFSNVPLAAVTIANNTGSTYYEVTTDNTGIINTYNIQVFLVNAAGTVSAPTASPMTTTVSFAPIGSNTNFPNFVSGSSTTTVNGSTFIACSTTLLFPYLTNGGTFESGIALSNTSLDNLGAKSASSVASQAGTCTLYFYGNATAASNPAAYTTASIPAGTVSSFTLTSTGALGFSGYALAECNFQYAHGFTYIVSSSTFQTNGVAMGYVAFPLAQPRGLVVGIETLGN